MVSVGTAAPARVGAIAKSFGMTRSMSSSVRFRLTRASSVDSLFTFSVSIFPRPATNCWLAALFAWSSIASVTCPNAPRFSEPKISRSMSGTTSEKKIAVRSRRYARKYMNVGGGAASVFPQFVAREVEEHVLEVRLLLDHGLREPAPEERGDERARRVHRDDLAVIHHRDPIAEDLCLVHVVRREEDRRPRLTDPAHELPEIAAGPPGEGRPPPLPGKGPA